MNAEHLHPLDNNYWKHVGVAEDVIKMGAQYGLISNSDAKRGLRMLVSQGNDLFMPSVMAAPDVMRDPNALKDWFSDLMSKGTAEQQGGNFGPRIEGHHPVSVSSTQAAGAHLPITQHGEFINETRGGGIPIGTEAPNMYGLVKNVHTGNNEFNAHMNPLTMQTDEGFWQGNDFSSYSDPRELANAFIDQSANPQIMMADVASMQAGQDLVEEDMARAAGVKQRALQFTERSKNDKTFANQIKQRLAKEKYDTQAVAADVFGTGPTARGGKKTSSNILAQERPDANIVRRDLGLSGNEIFIVGDDNDVNLGIRSNNPRRRM